MMGENMGDNTFLVTDVSLTIGEPGRYDLAPAEHRSFTEGFRAKSPMSTASGLSPRGIRILRASRNPARVICKP